MNLMIVVYKQSDESKSVQLSRSLHGYVDKSNHGQYSYERKGLLDKIPYQKLMNGVFILRKEDAEATIRPAGKIRSRILYRDYRENLRIKRNFIRIKKLAILSHSRGRDL